MVRCWGVGEWITTGPAAHPSHPSASLHAASRIRPGALLRRASLPRRCGRPVGVGFFVVLPMASLASSLSRSALRARDALVLELLPLADAIASVMARRLFPLVEREDLIQVAREALVRSTPRCRAGEPAAPYLRSSISGALQHHLRDQVRLVSLPLRLHKQGCCPLGHASLDAPAAGEHSLLHPLEPSHTEPSLEQLVDELPAAWATPCGSPSSRPSLCKPPRHSCSSARWPCSGPRRRSLLEYSLRPGLRAEVIRSSISASGTTLSWCEQCSMISALVMTAKSDAFPPSRSSALAGAES